jgi:hypothetical protein
MEYDDQKFAWERMDLVIGQRSLLLALYIGGIEWSI